MKAWWPTTPKPGNLGDILVPWMMRRDGVEPEFVSPNYPGKILGIGSTIRFAQAGDQVWTTGAMRLADRPNPKANFRALRGPIAWNLPAFTAALSRRPTGYLGSFSSLGIASAGITRRNGILN